MLEFPNAKLMNTMSSSITVNANTIECSPTDDFDDNTRRVFIQNGVKFVIANRGEWSHIESPEKFRMASF